MQIPKWPVAGERERELLDRVLASPQWGGFHEIVGEFERAFADFQHCRFGVSAFNGTVTLEMMLTCLGIGPGDEVIVPAISFVSTATAVSRVGATPVFVDIEEFSFNLDPERVRAALSPRTRAILAVHFGGPLAEIEQLDAIARERGILLLEDAAHAQGSEWNGRRAGSFGHAASFSFQNGKVLTAGEGGIVTTNDEALAVAMRSLANCGRRAGENFFNHYELGTNFRLTGLQAAVLVAQLERLPDQISLRTRNAERIRQEVDLPGLTWQKLPPQVNRHSQYLLLGRIDAARLGRTRDEFHRSLSAAGVPATPFYPHALYQNPLYQRGGCRVEPCPVAEACVRDAFWLPHRVLMGDEALTAEIIGALRAALAAPSSHAVLAAP